jgi:hypothetical protein
MQEEVFLFAAACRTGCHGGINEFLGAHIFCMHAVISVLDSEGPGSEISCQNRLEAETESQIGVEVGLKLDFKLVPG